MALCQEAANSLHNKRAHETKATWKPEVDHALVPYAPLCSTQVLIGKRKHRCDYIGTVRYCEGSNSVLLPPPPPPPLTATAAATATNAADDWYVWSKEGLTCTDS